MVAVAAAAMVGVAAADRLVKRAFGQPPRRTGTGPQGAADVRIPATDGSSLRGWFVPVQGKGPAAVVVHGWGGNAGDMVPVADRLHALGLHVLLLDAHGHGRSPAIPVSSMPAFAQDVRDATRWLRARRDVDAARVVLVGHSVGAGACLFAASEDPQIPAVVALAPMADPVGFMSASMQGRLPRALIPWALRYIEHTIGHRFEDFTPLNTVSRVAAPVLLVHGAQDTTVPVRHAQMLHERSRGVSTLYVVDGADHFSVDSLDQVDLAGFLSATLQPRVSQPVLGTGS
jgi:alpha-beta hydrolase superfamily lysophospholipase